MKYLSVCSGIEAATVAWEPLGWEPIAFAEIDPFASAVLAHRWPEVPNLGDFTRIQVGDLSARPDVVVGGTPCQAFSVAGLRNSLEDERGNLTLGFVHLVDRLQPQAILWENVPGVLSTKDNAFGFFLAGLAGADEPLRPAGKRWSNAGLVYGRKRRIAWRVLDAQYFGVAQRRKRLFVVACPVEGADPAAILLEREGDGGNFVPSGKARKAPATDTRLDAALGQLLGERVQADLLSNLLPLDAESAPMIMASGQANSEFASDFCTTQSARQYKDPPILAYSIREDAKANTFSATEIESARALQTIVPSVQSHHAQTFVLQTQDLADPLLVKEDCTYTHEGKSFRLRNVIPFGMLVRRLLPVECSRLQGFPDDHAKIPWKGKPVEECPDGHQYKCYGNSMAVPVIAWLGSRIEAVLTGKPFTYGIPARYRAEIESR